MGSVDQNQGSGRQNHNLQVQSHSRNRMLRGRYEMSAAQTRYSTVPYPVHLLPSWTLGFIQAGGFGVEDGIDFDELHSSTSKTRNTQKNLVNGEGEGSSTGKVHGSSVIEGTYISDHGANSLKHAKRKTRYSEYDDMEEEMLKAAIEASMIESMRMNSLSANSKKEDDLAQAIAESLKIEKEKLSREAYSWYDDDVWNVNPQNSFNDQTRSDPSTSSSIESRSHLTKNQSVETNISSQEKDYWESLSTEEQQDAIMLEAAMFGSMPEDLALHFERSYGGGIARPPSPTLLAQRQLREQQDIEYLASLQADQEKEAKEKLAEEARRLKEAEEKAAEEKRQQEEALNKRLAEEALERQIVAKRASLPQEPPANHEDVIKLIVRMPDGCRQGRRFYRSQSFQYLYDFLDVTCGLVPGSYRLVRQYPRKLLCDSGDSISFNDLGLTSKSEALFVEFMD